MKIWNMFETAEDRGKKIHMPYGEWPWDERTMQRLTKEKAERIAEKLETEIMKGEPGIPVYQGHPDVPELAAKYPDKGALGWIKRIECNETECLMSVEWDRYPGKGFAWFSPYWRGETSREKGKIMVTVDELMSVGLVNRPNIHAFRLPNEEIGNKTEEQIMKEILAALGLAETAKAEEAVAAINKLKGDCTAKCAECAEAATAKKALEDECAKGKCANEKLAKELEEAKTALANSEKSLEETKKALANESEELKKVKELKTKSVTEGLANEKVTKTDNRLTLVNELMNKKSISFDQAWCLAKEANPELFK